MKEDLEEYALGNNKDVDIDNMTEEEKSFYYFKIHDTDNNDFLDGLEMLHAATHRGVGHFHKLDRMNELEKFEDELIHIVGRWFSMRREEKTMKF
jgi:multiple coagulation factor deficiency protein 2